MLAVENLYAEFIRADNPNRNPKQCGHKTGQGLQQREANPQWQTNPNCTNNTSEKREKQAQVMHVPNKQY